MGLADLLKKIPIDFGQGNLRDRTKGKLIAKELVSPGEGKKSLDVGCREGIQAKWLEDKGYDVTPIDIEKVYEEAEVVDVNEPLPYDDETFDLIWCSEVIEHLEDPEFSVEEFRRVLKPGGDMILTTPNSHFWIYPLLRPFGLTPKKLQNPDHTHFFHIDDIKEIFPDADIYGFFPYLLLKFRIENFIGPLSPTFVIHERK